MDDESKAEFRIMYKEIDAMKSNVDQLEQHIYGCADFPGIKTRVDRIEQRDIELKARGVGHSKATIAVCTLLGVVASVIGNIIIALIRGGP